MRLHLSSPCLRIPWPWDYKLATPDLVHFVSFSLCLSPHLLDGDTTCLTYVLFAVKTTEQDDGWLWYPRSASITCVHSNGAGEPMHRAGICMERAVEGQHGSPLWPAEEKSLVLGRDKVLAPTGLGALRLSWSPGTHRTNTFPGIFPAWSPWP